jgi:Domain of unknown function (DUF4188)
MPEIINGRMAARMDRPFVVFLIGMRMNNWFAVDKWSLAVNAMPKMMRELYAHPELGFLGGHFWFGKTTISLQYWNSYEQLEAYAHMRDRAHLPAWAEFNRKVAKTGTVGVWHETYLSGPGQYENIYSNMPRFGLGGVGQLAEATGKRERAVDRLRVSAE